MSVPKIKGANFLELMVILAIVAVVTAIIYPIYKEFSTRTKVTAGVVTLEDLEDRVIEYYSVHGKFPTTADINKLPSDFATDLLNYGKVGPSGWEGGDDKTPFVEIEFASDVIPSQVAPRLALLATVHGSSVTWKCYTYSADQADYSISVKFLPGDCEVHP